MGTISAPLDEQLIDTAAAAVILGVKPRTIQAWVQQNRIPYVKLGGAGRGSRTRFRPSALQAYIAAREHLPGGANDAR